MQPRGLGGLPLPMEQESLPEMSSEERWYVVVSHTLSDKGDVAVLHLNQNLHAI